MLQSGIARCWGRSIPVFLCGSHTDSTVALQSREYKVFKFAVLGVWALQNGSEECNRQLLEFRSYSHLTDALHCWVLFNSEDRIGRFPATWSLMLFCWWRQESALWRQYFKFKQDSMLFVIGPGIQNQSLCRTRVTSTYPEEHEGWWHVRVRQCL